MAMEPWTIFAAVIYINSQFFKLCLKRELDMGMCVCVWMTHKKTVKIFIM